MRAHRWQSAVLAAALAVGLTSTARAQSGFGESKRTVLSLENLAGFSYERLKVGDGDAASTTQTGTFTPFVSPLGARMRLGIHHFVAPPLSLGALLSYSDNDQIGTYYLAGARVGVGLPLAPTSAVWLRGGISYARVSVGNGDDETSFATLSPGAEAFFVLQPYESFGVLLGGTFETSVWGQRKAKQTRINAAGTGTEKVDTKDDFKHLELALCVGIFAAF